MDDVNNLQPQIDKDRCIMEIHDIESLTEAMAIFDINKDQMRKFEQYMRRMTKSGLSIEVYAPFKDARTRSETESSGDISEGSGNPAGGVSEVSLKSDTNITILCMERKIDVLTELLVEQSQLMSSIKREVKRSSVAVQHTVDTHAKLASEMINIAFTERAERSGTSICAEDDACSAFMAALDVDNKSTERVLKKSLNEVIFSDVFREQLVNAASDAMKIVFSGDANRELCSSYLRELEKSKAKMIEDITSALNDAFRKLETNTAMFARESYRASRALRLALERHLSAVRAAEGGALRDTVREVLEKELAQWRDTISGYIIGQVSKEAVIPSPTDYMPPNPPPPCEQWSGLGQFTHVQISDGDVNGAFVRALCAGDLARVVAACRASDPARVFGPPCRLEQRVLLSLIQQLATDLVHDTQLKCRYLEEAIMNLDRNDQIIVMYITKVFSDVKMHVTRFLKMYPNHMAGRRLRMITMVADSFLKNNFNYSQ